MLWGFLVRISGLDMGGILGLIGVIMAILIRIVRELFSCITKIGFYYMCTIKDNFTS